MSQKHELIEVISRAQCGNFMIFLNITQILREINFRDPRSAKSAILTHLESLNFDFYEFLHFSKAEIYQINKIMTPKMT